MAEVIAHATLGAPTEQRLVKGSTEWSLHQPAQSVDPKDVGTPDAWVMRNPELIRNTGRHPLNCEPTMEKLLETGLISPISYHFVRNHGAVPRLDWSTHRLEITGLVNRPMSFSMDEIMKFPSVTLPVTLTCSGNRRKEANMIKKSIGFNWGPTATACTYWTGVRLSDILRHVGAMGPDEGAYHVCFRGPKGELPKGDDGSYGTSIPLGHAINPVNDVLVAYKQNGRWLTPDHGFPLRMIVPGFIAGRMVKYLSQITVTSEESTNFYHMHDNRNFPSHVDQEVAKEEGWFTKPGYNINELNINSAVARPWHDELVSLQKNDPYTVTGYAYSGGGRHVIRVEVSLDAGRSWRQAKIERVNSNNDSGKTWAWVFWKLEVQVFDFLDADELLVRAVDSSQNFQPDKLTWNVMGMVNNCQFRVLVHKQLCDNGEMCLRFQHPAPTEVGEFGSLGWRENKTVSVPRVQAPFKQQMTIQEEKPVSQEETKVPNVVHDSMWNRMAMWLDDAFGSLCFTSRRKVGWRELVNEQAQTSQAPLKILPVSSRVVPVSTDKELTDKKTEESLVALHPKKKIPFKLAKKIELSDDSKLFRFALQSPNHRLGLPVGQHVFIYANINGEPCMRAYTPSSSDDDLGYFDLVIKVYRANENAEFPEGGRMSQYLDTLKIGDTIDVKGPIGHFTYTGKGNCIRNRKPVTAKKLTMIAGGTGITPMYQIIKAVLKDPSDTTQIKLLYANRRAQDILLHKELEALASKRSNFKIEYTLTAPPAGWRYSTGRITKNMLEKFTFRASDDGLVLLCGPKGMIDVACKPNLEQMGWSKTQFVEF